MNQNIRYVHRGRSTRGIFGWISSTTETFLILAFCIAVFTVGGCATAKVSTVEPPKPVITNIAVEDNTVTISATQPFSYTIYKPGDPYKIVVDIPDALVGDFTRKIVSQKRGISEITPSQVESPTLLARLELLLETPSAVDQDYRDNMLTVKVRNSLPVSRDLPRELKLPDSEEKAKVFVARALNPAPDPQSEIVPPKTALPKATEITGISFDTSEGAVKVLIYGNGPMTPNVFPLENRLVIDIADVVLNAPLPTKVVSPVRAIRSGKHDNKTRMVIDLKEMTKFDVAAVGDAIVVTVREEGKPSTSPSSAMKTAEPKPLLKMPSPATEPELSAKEKCQSYLDGKESINFDFQDQDIVPIFRLFADISGCNLFIHPDVKGKATMKFTDVPWNQALDTILSTFSLGKSIEGNIIKIAPHSVFTKESEEKAKARDALALAVPLETRIFSVSYAKVKDVEAAIKSAKLLSPRGSTSVDERTSTILVQDTADVLPKVESLLATLDKPTPQVLIEARIVEVNTATKRDLGIQWGMNLQATNTLSSIGGLSGVPLLSPGPFTGRNYLVDFPAKNVGPLSGSGFTFGFLSPDRTFGLDLQLSAIETIGQGKVISNPKILTVDHGRAKILQGKSIPVRKLTAEGTVSTEFKDVTMELNVTPHITPDGAIGMSIEIKKEEIDQTVPSIEGVPGTDKKEANTNVIIRNGETVVIGGMYKVQTADQESGVPGLMKIPILGWLFKNKVKESRTDELLIFITPRIVEKP